MRSSHSSCAWQMGAMHLCSAKWINEEQSGNWWYSTVSFSFSLSFTSSSYCVSLSFSSIIWFCLRPWIPLPWTTRTGGNGVEMARLYLNGDSQSASCIIIRYDISIHTRFFLSPRTFVLPVRQNTSVLSAWRYGAAHCFPHTSFYPAFNPAIHTIPFFIPPPFCQH